MENYYLLGVLLGIASIFVADLVVGLIVMLTILRPKITHVVSYSKDISELIAENRELSAANRKMAEVIEKLQSNDYRFSDWKITNKA